MKQPRQQRSRETLQRVLTATEELLCDQTLEQLTIREILKRANVSTGSFYARFDGKEALIQAIWDELRLTVDEFLEADPLPAGAPLSERATLLVTQRVKRYRKYRGIFRAFILRLRQGLPPLSDEDRRAYLRSQKKLITFFMRSKREIRHPDPERAIAFAEFAMSSAARELILYPTSPHASTIKTTQRQLVDELTQMFVGYLTSSPAVS
ncbi:MAG: TetR/AcrR family transcriptional regulator [Planctomycetota bacterium]